MDLRAVSRQLRHAADVLDDLLERPGTPAVAKKIEKTMDRQAIPVKPAKKRKKHWTQTKAGRAKMAEVQRQSWLARKQHVARKKAHA